MPRARVGYYHYIWWRNGMINTLRDECLQIGKKTNAVQARDWWRYGTFKHQFEGAKELTSGARVLATMLRTKFIAAQQEFNNSCVLKNPNLLYNKLCVINWKIGMLSGKLSLTANRKRIGQCQGTTLPPHFISICFRDVVRSMAKRRLCNTDIESGRI